jgi:hypothetical protein
VEAIIQEVVSTVHAVDGSALLDERTMGQIVRAVVAAIEIRQAQEGRRSADTGTRAPAAARGIPT